MHDPGWNDPPLLTYDSTSQASVKTGILHKPKRIAFPLGSPPPSTPPSSASPLSSTPPRCSPLVPRGTPPPNQTASFFNPADASPANKLPSVAGCSATELPLDKNEALSKVMGVFDDVMESVGDMKREEGDVRKRLSVMKKMWEDDKLDARVQLQMVHLAEALESGQDATANEIQVRLGVDFTAQCSTFIAGIRRLVHLASSNPPGQTQQCSADHTPCQPVAMLDQANVSQEVTGQVLVASSTDALHADEAEVKMDSS